MLGPDQAATIPASQHLTNLQTLLQADPHSYTEIINIANAMRDNPHLNHAIKGNEEAIRQFKQAFQDSYHQACAVLQDSDASSDDAQDELDAYYRAQWEQFKWLVEHAHLEKMGQNALESIEKGQMRHKTKEEHPFLYDNIFCQMWTEFLGKDKEISEQEDITDMVDDDFKIDQNKKKKLHDALNRNTIHISNGAESYQVDIGSIAGNGHSFTVKFEAQTTPAEKVSIYTKVLDIMASQNFTSFDLSKTNVASFKHNKTPDDLTIELQHLQDTYQRDKNDNLYKSSPAYRAALDEVIKNTFDGGQALKKLIEETYARNPNATFKPTTPLIRAISETYSTAEKLQLHQQWRQSQNFHGNPLAARNTLLDNAIPTPKNTLAIRPASSPPKPPRHPARLAVVANPNGPNPLDPDDGPDPLDPSGGNIAAPAVAGR